MRKKKTISFVGISKKFTKIFKSIYPTANFNFYSWRSLEKSLLKKKFIYKNDFVVVCGYDYSSQWYEYQKYYKCNVIFPYKVVRMISKKNTKIFYIDTVNKISKNKHLKKKYTFSRYEFAKKELRKVLLNNFKSVKVLTLPILANNENKAEVFGSFFTKIIYNFLIMLNYVKTTNLKNLKRRIIEKISSNKKDKIINLRPGLLNIPRSLFIDRILRFLND